MASYGQYCPVAKATELLGDRWTLLIVRELIYGPIRFSDMERNLPGISRSTLSSRLKRMQRDGIATRDDDGAYVFTEAGEALRPVVKTLGDWVARWVMADPTRDEADPELLMLYVSRHVATDELPERRVVIEWHFTDQGRRIWLTLERDDVSVCVENPCLDVDLYVSGDTVDLYRVYLHRCTLDDAVARGDVDLSGVADMRRGFRRWIRWSDFGRPEAAALTDQRAG